MIELKNREFRIWSYISSHSFLLIRSPMLFFDNEGFNTDTSYNIDLEFTEVVYMEIPEIFNELKIVVKNIKDIPNRIQDKVTQNTKIFELQTNRNIYYILAMNLVIGKNEWGTESRTNNLSFKHEQIIFSC
jgi:hypothetical protein